MPQETSSADDYDAIPDKSDLKEKGLLKTLDTENHTLNLKTNIAELNSKRH